MKLIRTTSAICLAAILAVSCSSRNEELEDALSQLDQLESEINSMDVTDEDLNDLLNDIDANASGELFTSADGHFSIMFPGTPSISDENVDTEVGAIEMKTFMYEKSITEAYMVAYSDYPSLLVEMSNVEDLLQGGKSGALESLGINASTLDEEKDLELDGNTGKYFKGNNGQYYVVYEMYLVNNRLYQIAILRDGSYPTQAETDMFIGSFTLNNTGDAE